MLMKDCMTAVPQSIGFDQTVEKAKDMMERYGIRHLPVLEEGKLVGVISDRDLNLITGLSLDEKKITVEEALTPEPYVVSPNETLENVITTMAETKIGSALVGENGRVVGIFTGIDALRILADYLKANG